MVADQRIGMCCACGAYCDKRKSVIVLGNEYCPECADLIAPGGYDPDDSDGSDDDD